MDNLNPLLIAIVPALLTYLGTKYKSQNEREEYASKAWQSLYDEIKQRMDESEKESSESIKALQTEVQKLKEDMSALRANHAQEVKALNEQNVQLKEENRQLRTENANYKNRLIELGEKFNGV
uniref:hypothetical protein n=1 Tax=Jeotgalibaca porci TaxID=1868793 RepID=UPI0035A0A863